MSKRDTYIARLAAIVHGSLYTQAIYELDTICVWYGGQEFHTFRLSSGESAGTHLIARPSESRRIHVVEAHSAIQEHLLRMRRGIE